MPAVFSSGATSNSSKAKNSNLFGSGSSKGTYTPAPVYSPPKATYYPPAPVYSPPPVKQYYYEPEPVYTPPKATYTPPKNTYSPPKPVAPAPSPVKTAVQQIIDKAITVPKPAVTAPVVDPMTTALKAQTATVTPWRSPAQPLYKEAKQPGTTTRNELAAGNLLYDLDNLNAMIALAQDRENQNQPMPGVYTPGTQAPDEGPSNDLLALLDAREQLLNPGNTGLSGSLSTISNTGGDILTGAWTGLEDGLGLVEEGPELDNTNRSGYPFPTAAQESQLFDQQMQAARSLPAGTPYPMGTWVRNPDNGAFGFTPGSAADYYQSFVSQPSTAEPYPYDPIDVSDVWAPGQEFGPYPYYTPDGWTMVWDPVSQMPVRVPPEDVVDWYGAMYGIDVTGDQGWPGAGFLGGFFLDEAMRAIENTLGSGDGSYTGDSSGGGSYGYGGGGSYGYGGGGGYGSGGGGGGGGGSSVGGIPIGDVTSDMEGWASRYLPASADEVLKNPSVIGYDTINDLGFDSDQLRAIFGDQAEYVVNQLLPFLFADTPIGQTPSISSTINKVNEVLKGMATPGGSTIDVAKLLELLFGQASQNKDSKNPTLMGGMFAGLTPSEQASAMNALVSNASNWAATPFFGQAIRNWYDAQQDSYLSGALSATPNGKSLGELLSGMIFPGAS